MIDESALLIVFECKWQNSIQAKPVVNDSFQAVISLVLMIIFDVFEVKFLSRIKAVSDP